MFIFLMCHQVSTSKVVVCVLRGMHATQHTHHNLTHMLPQ